MSLPTIAGVPRAQPIVEIGVGNNYDPQGTAQWQVSQWGNPAATWSGHEPSFIDITCLVHEVETFVGRDRSTDVWEVGTASLTVDNSTGWADYPPTHLDPDFDPLLSVRPGRDIRVGVVVDGGNPKWVWRGVIDVTNPGYDPELGDICVFDCIDAKGDAGRSLPAKLAVAVGAGEPADNRVGRILNAVNWPSARRTAQVSSVALIATTLEGRAVDLLNSAAESSGGAVFGDPQGRVAYRARDWQTATAATVTDATISNSQMPEPMPPSTFAEEPPGSGLVDPGAFGIAEDPAGSGLYRMTGDQLVEDPPTSGLYAEEASRPPQMCPSGWEVSFNRADFPNRVIGGRSADEEPRVWTDPEGMRALGVETYEVTSLETVSDTEIGNIANRILATRDWDLAPRIAAVTVDAATGPEAVDVLTVVSPYKPSRIACHHNVSGREVFSRLMLCTGIAHTITPEGWTARIALDDAGPYAAVGSGRWGTTGHWNQTRWVRAA